MKMQPVILVIDDQLDIRLSARLVLQNHNYTVLEAESPVQALSILQKGAQVNLILLDMNFSADTTSGEEGIGFLQKLEQHDLTIPVVSMTAWANVKLAVKAMQLGARDFIEKPWKNQRLLQIISQQLQLDELRQENRKLKQQQSDHQAIPELVWQSDAMKRVFAKLDKIAKTDATLLLTGENGTGKSTIAKYMHQRSRRVDQPLVSVNMGAIPETLFESEMFGHRKGAFTDAKSDRIGRFELAENGTLFLDEVANIPLSLQAKLLRVLEDGQFEKVGASQSQQANVRIVCATNADIITLIESGKFRADLYFRLNTMEVHIPSLKDRPEDIGPLADYFLKKHAMKYGCADFSLSEATHQHLLRYSWPGNVRELGHVMERTVLLAGDPHLEPKDIELDKNFMTSHVAVKSLSAIEQDSSNSDSTDYDLNQNDDTDINLKQNDATHYSMPLITLEEAEVSLIKIALQECNGNVQESAVKLGITTSALYRRLEKYRIGKSYV